MTAHKHAALMLQYAKDAMETDKPWERWEWFDDKSWYPCSNPPVWEVNMKYRRKPQTIKVGKWEFPKPITFAPKIDTIYWVIRLHPEGFAPDDLIWSGDKADFDLLGNRMIHLSREAAQTHADVLNAICRGDVE
nr:hypothetical protein [Neisseria meningitidis]